MGVWVLRRIGRDSRDKEIEKGLLGEKRGD